MGKIKDAMPKKHEPEKNACQRAWYKIIFFERKQGVQRHTPWEKKGYTCTRKKGENKPILSEPLLEIREMIITQKEFKKKIIPIFEYDASLHDLQGLAWLTQGKCAVSPSIPEININKLRGRMSKKQYLGEKWKYKWETLRRSLQEHCYTFMKNAKTQVLEHE
jgi:hypothetical protein